MIYTIAEISATVVDFFFLIWYVPGFLGTKFWEGKNRKMIFAPIVLFAFQFVADTFIPGFDLLMVFLYIGVIMVYSLYICNGKRFHAVIATASYVLAIMFVGSIVFIGVSLIVGERVQALQGTDSPARIIYLVICKFVEFWIYYIFLHLFQKDGTTERKTVFFFSIYMLLIVVGLGAVMYITLEDTEGNLVAPIVMIMIILTVSVFLLFFFVNKLLKAQKLEYEYRFLEDKIETEKRILDESERVWENVSKIRHDLKNHLTIIKAKLNEGDVTYCENYIDKIYPQIDDIGKLVKTGNSVVDYLVSSKFDLDDDVKVKISGNADVIGNISDTDIVGLIGNLLDNALEAVKDISDEREKRVELYFLTPNNNRIIICQNTVDHPVLENNHNLVTTKKGIGHGYGKKIIGSIAEKYGGFVEYIDKPGMFCVQVVLPG